MTSAVTVTATAISRPGMLCGPAGPASITIGIRPRISVIDAMNRQVDVRARRAARNDVNQ
ncbi:NHL repeat containing protein, precursor [Mycolicibacterium thermoresistibile]|uniref:NHL repeat containing protein n=1 Tax=Mycolicibacterium thermoresistibile TaxID=1797 RepID=A0A100XJ42_MYCTH|nr:NHL repeat containing protein, precursor [Mycolicibacterium thermoresistibile]